MLEAIPFAPKKEELLFFFARGLLSVTQIASSKIGKGIAKYKIKTRNRIFQNLCTPLKFVDFPLFHYGTGYYGTGRKPDRELGVTNLYSIK